MGDQLYAYRSKYSLGHGDDDSWQERSYVGGEKVSRTNVYDGDGRPRPVYSGDGRPRPISGHNPGETYVVQTEVTESFVRPASHFHSYGSPTQSPPPVKKVTEQYAAPYGIGGTYADKPRGFSSPTSYKDRNHCPPEVDDFLTAVQIEASRAQPVHSPRSPYNHRNGLVNGRFELDRNNYRDHRKNNKYDSGDSGSDSDRERDDDRYYYNPNKVATAKTKTTSWSEVSSPKAYGHGTGRLGMPTSNIEELVHGLKVTANKPHEYGTEYGTAPEAVKPYVGHAYSNGYGSDGTTKYQQRPEAVKPYGGEVSKPYGYGHEAAKPYGTAAKYGDGATNNYSSSSSSVIDCYEAAKKYNGKVIRT